MYVLLNKPVQRRKGTSSNNSNCASAAVVNYAHPKQSKRRKKSWAEAQERNSWRWSDRRIFPTILLNKDTQTETRIKINISCSRGIPAFVASKR